MSDQPGADLDAAQVAAALGDRPVQAYPALLSTEPVAMGWARSGATTGAVVVADYQAAARGRGGWPWTVQAGVGLGFTLLLRLDLPPEREGWPYVPSLLGLHDVLAPDGGSLLWPDTVVDAADAVLARLGVYVELGPSRTEWATVTVLVEQAAPPRPPLLRRLLEAIEARVAQSPEQVLADYLARCSTLGREHWARLIPLGPGGPSVTGEAVDVLADGALVLRTARGSRVAIPPQNLGLLQDPEGPVEAPEQVLGRFPT
jgi:BirA family biotin operon repressor/biotin-[acetyl-CoA-carboxylase] ligase